jgi:hypothetical protein
MVTARIEAAYDSMLTCEEVGYSELMILTYGRSIWYLNLAIEFLGIAKSVL